MERIQEMEESIREYWTERTRIKKDFITEHYEKLKLQFQKILKTLVDEQCGVGRDAQKKIQSVYLYQLRTSTYTESYETILGMAASNPYLDENKSQTYWYPELVYKNIGDDMKAVELCLRKKFIRIEAHELFRLKLILLNDDWTLLQEIFLKLIKDSMDLIMNSPLQLESELQILSGNYMEKPENLWSITKEGSVIE